MNKIVFLAILVAVSAGLARAQSADQLKKSARGVIDALNKHDFTRFADYLTADAIDYGQGPMPLKGKSAIVASLTDFFGAFPNSTVTLDGIAIEGNRTYVQNTFTGTHTGLLGGMFPATNKQVVWRDVDIFEFDKNGKIAAHWANNPNAVLDQIGYHAFTNPNTAVVMAAYSAFGKGDVPGILAQCSPDVEFDVTDRVFMPNGMIYKGAGEVPAFFKTLAEKVTFVKFDPYRFLADGDDVAVYINGEYRDNKTGAMSKANIVHQFKVVMGKITRFKGNTDMPKEITVETR